MTAEEIRQEILTAVSHNGGHLASSLGAVEIAMALSEVFDPQRDRIVWDVGHQAYAWKILTGRREQMASLRQLRGLSGFPNPHESPCDAAIAGHAGVALSVAEGYAAAREATGAHYESVAVIGDASIVNGTSFEALNNCQTCCHKVIVVLNDNGMAISKPVGSIARFLGRIHSGSHYNRVKNAAKKAGHALRLSFLYGFVHRFKGRIKSMFLENVFFEQFGFHYIGPVDGHDLAALKAAFRVAKQETRSVLVHVLTKKGRGYAPAENDPVHWHGTGPFSLAPTSAASAVAASPSWSAIFGQTLLDLASHDDRLVALTAGMTDGTGLADFAKQFPTRFFDMGIAESHLVAFAAGLAAGGRRPVVAVYSTFLQRAIDQVMHDVAIANLSVIFAIDRAGVVGADGVTHQGLYDLALLKCLPNLSILQPRSAEELAQMFSAAIQKGGPVAIRYPRGCPALDAASAPVAPIEWGRAEVLSSGTDLMIWALGDRVDQACRVAKELTQRGYSVGVVNARFVKPFDAELLARQRAAGIPIASIENAALAGGFGESLGADWRFGWPDVFVPHGKPSELEKEMQLDAASITERLTQLLVSSTSKQKDR